jgi:hypothetical protein
MTFDHCPSADERLAPPRRSTTRGRTVNEPHGERRARDACVGDTPRVNATRTARLLSLLDSHRESDELLTLVAARLTSPLVPRRDGILQHRIQAAADGARRERGASIDATGPFARHAATR